jgi:hypothetical protein
MGFFDDLARTAADVALDFVPGGGVIKTIAKKLFGTDDEDEVQKIIQADPAKALELEKAILEHKVDMARVKLDEQREENRAKEEDNKELNKRMRDLEGTASDLKQAGFFGRLVLFARGAQRPTWGFFVLYMVIRVFSGSWDISGDPQLTSAFWLIVLIVLIFLFGERAAQNVLPVLLPFLRGMTKRGNGNQATAIGGE